METVNENLSGLFRENEIKNNRLISIAVLICGLFFLVATAVNFTGVHDIGPDLLAGLLFFPGLFDIAVYFFGRYCSYRAKWLKWLILWGVLFSGSVTFFLYPFSFPFLTYGPLLVSAMYYNLKLIRCTAALNWLFYTSLMVANVMLENSGGLIQELHAVQGLRIWQQPYTLVTDYYLPVTVLYGITVLICDGIARRGRRLVQKQAEINAEVSAMEGELKAAAHLQLSTLPAAAYRSADGRLSVQAFIRPARLVGGDFYHYFLVGDNLVFLVADVSDKGLSAAMFMMRAKNTVTTAVQSSSSLAAAMERVNAVLCQDNPDSMFVTVWIAGVNIHTGIGKYVNCGHLPPLIKHIDGSVTKPGDSPDPLLGVLEGVEPQAHTLRLASTDTLFIFSDGLTDAENAAGEFFGAERLRQAVEGLQAGTDDLCSEVIAAVDRFAGGTSQSDDMTLLTLRLQEGGQAVTKHFRFRADYDSIEQLIDEANVLLKEKQCPEDARREICTAFDEICANIVDYAYSGEEGRFEVSLTVGENYLEAVISDSGMPFDPLAAEEPALSDELQTGGFGIFIVKRFMDEVEYSREGGENRLRIFKIWGI